MHMLNPLDEVTKQFLNFWLLNTSIAHRDRAQKHHQLTDLYLTAKICERLTVGQYVPIISY